MGRRFRPPPGCCISPCRSAPSVRVRPPSRPAESLAKSRAGCARKFEAELIFTGGGYFVWGKSRRLGGAQDVNATAGDETEAIRADRSEGGAGIGPERIAAAPRVEGRTMINLSIPKDE